MEGKSGIQKEFFNQFSRRKEGKSMERTFKTFTLTLVVFFHKYSFFSKINNHEKQGISRRTNPEILKTS